MRATLLLLADTRFPGGGHAHSGGIEAAADRIADVAALERFLVGRLYTAGRCAAALAAFACRLELPWSVLDVEADARMPSGAQRAASRGQGRGLLRVARRAWPHTALDELDATPHHAIAIGATARVASLGPQDAALAAAYASVSGPSAAAIRLLAFDPIEVAALNARLMPDVDALADEVAWIDDLPSDASPLLEIDAERHARWEVRLFAS